MQVFYFDLLQQPFDAAPFRRSIDETIIGLDNVAGVPTWTLNSHDVHRSVTRYGLIEPVAIHSSDPNALRTRARGLVDVDLGTRRAKAATLLMLALPGSVYLYQGEELGLPEVQNMPDHRRQDPIWERSGHTEYGRDGCRVPLPWTTDTNTGFGFLPGADANNAWLPQPSWFSGFAAQIQANDPSSVLSFYREALKARRGLDTTSPLQWIDIGRDDVIAFRRGDLACATVFSGTEFTAPAAWGQPVCRSDSSTGPLAAGTTGWWLRSDSDAD
jgi:alpha-glucosidase